MSIVDILLKIFGKKRSEALQSDVEAMQERFKAMQIEALQSASLPEPEETTFTSESKQPIEIEKDSLQLGLAAGFTGRSLRDIESSLSRIESQMTTKDWFNIEIKPFLQDRLDKLQNSLDSLINTVMKLPEPIRSDLLPKIQSIEAQLPLTHRMQTILSELKQAKELSYEELANRIGIQVSALRGLLSTMVKRTNEIQRFEKDGKGWVRYTGN